MKKNHWNLNESNHEWFWKENSKKKFKTSSKKNKIKYKDYYFMIGGLAHTHTRVAMQI
jgi:hypothetical protein